MSINKMLLSVFLTLTIVGITKKAEAQLVFSTQYKSDAQVKIYVSKYKSDADLVVYKASYKSDAGENNGVW